MEKERGKRWAKKGILTQPMNNFSQSRERLVEVNNKRIKLQRTYKINVCGENCFFCLRRNILLNDHVLLN